jgi:hypothetical protein
MLRSASSHYRRSALLARRAAAAADGASGVALASVLVTHQAAQARMSEQAVADMLTEQGLDVSPAGSLSPLAFTTDAQMLAQMVGPKTDVARLVESLVQDAGRAAESVATAARADMGHARYLSPPSCARCAILAGRVYRYSDGFKRHTNCDCVMIPTTVANPEFTQDPVDLMERGQIRGLSKADMQAVADGADLNKVVNVRRYSSGLRESGRVLARAGKPTPEGIYRLASDQQDAVRMLRRFGYLT